jgi:hypothetical protein
VCITGSANSVWFDYTATSDTTLAVDLDDRGSSYFAVYTGSRGALRRVSDHCESNYSDPDLMPVTAGTTYHVMVIHDWGNTRLTVDEVRPPANDDFADATPISTVPATAETRLGAATAEPGEPDPSCTTRTGSPSAWFAFTAPRTESISLKEAGGDYDAILAVYTGDSLGGLTEVRCVPYGLRVLTVTAGRTYHVQVVNPSPEAIPTVVALAVAPSLKPYLNYSPAGPSTLDTIAFAEQTYDEAGAEITRAEWDFGDGATATGRNVQHRFAADGDYSVRLSVTAADGRTGTVTRTVAVRTHDVRIAAFTVPTRGRTDQTKSITVAVGNQRLPENATVTLYKGGPGGFVEIARATQYVPARPDRTVAFPFNYTFTPEDAAVGRVVFRAVVTLAEGVRDARTVDNEATAPATTVYAAISESVR